MLHLRHFTEKAADRWLAGHSLQHSLHQSWSVLQQKQVSPWWGVGVGSLLLTLLNGPLALSLGIGLVAYAELSQWTGEDWQRQAQRLQRPPQWPLSAQGKTRAATVAVLLFTYVITSLWTETHYFWLAAVLGGQSLLALWLAGLLLPPQLASRPLDADSAARETPPSPAKSAHAETVLDQQLQRLSEADALARLVAVRQLMRLAQTQSLEARYVPSSEISLRSHLLDCFHLMLVQETEPMVRSALKEGIDLLRQPAQLPPGQPAMTALERPLKQVVRRPVVEYVEP